MAMTVHICSSTFITHINNTININLKYCRTFHDDGFALGDTQYFAFGALFNQGLIVTVESNIETYTTSSMRHIQLCFICLVFKILNDNLALYTINS